jgi:hypothetical protein
MLAAEQQNLTLATLAVGWVNGGKGECTGPATGPIFATAMIGDGRQRPMPQAAFFTHAAFSVSIWL